LWDRGAALHQTRLAEAMGAQDPAFAGALHKLQAAGMSAHQAMAATTQQVVGQAYFLATLDIFRVSAWLVLLLIPCVWLTRKALANGASHAGAD
jgi:DHA2 family multidrug resistance protein